LVFSNGYAIAMGMGAHPDNTQLSLMIFISWRKIQADKDKRIFI
jgi:hypothetical protein